MKEIGGYIEFEHYRGAEFHGSAVKLNCSRCCLEYLIRLHGIKRIHIPYFLCDSVRKICARNAVEVCFYHIDENFLQVVPDADFSHDWLYAVNYYGQLTNEQIAGLAKGVPNLIVDNVQAFFQMPVPHVSTIYNCRKFFGVSDGAYLYSEKRLPEEFERDVSYTRMEFLLGRFEKSASEFYPQFVANNDLFASESVKRMSGLTENIMRSVDYERAKNVRTENFAFLHGRLGNMNKLRLSVPGGAFAYPLYIENGAEIRKRLQAEKIYIPTLWSDVFDVCNENDLEYHLAKDILPLPVDQRYGKEEMWYMVQNIERILREL